MFLVDANILVYATNTSSPHHGRALEWLDANLASRPQTVGLPWPSLLGFLRLVTNPRVFSAPASPTAAWARIEDWIARAGAWIPQPTERHPVYLAQILRESNVAGDLVPDAHLAALALEHGLTVASADFDFARFASVRWFNPVRGEVGRT